MKKLLVICLPLILTLAACSSAKDESTTVPESKTSKADVGPFALKLSTTNKTAVNKFNVDINQREGKVEFNLAPVANTTWMKLKSTEVKVTGCKASQVKVTRIWLTGSDTLGPIIEQGDTFYADPGVKGQFVVMFTNLTGCESLSYSMNIEHLTNEDIPKFWSYDVNNVFGLWTNASNNLSFYINNGYIGIESTRGTTCYVALNSAKVDETQTPQWLSTVGDQILCSYTKSGDGVRAVMKISCNEPAGWNCGSLKNLTLYR